MSGLFASLSNNIKALTAQSRAIETSGKNLANVNNPSYARQRVAFGDRGQVQTDLGVQSLGVEATQIQQLRDVLLDRQVLREVSLSSSYTTQQAAYQNAQAGLGQTIDRTGETSSTGTAGSSNGIGGSLSNFFAVFQSFAASPTDAGERQTLIEKAGILTDQFQSVDTRLSQVQSDLTTQATSDVADVNNILSTIADLNGQIGRFEVNLPGSAVDLRDQRQAQLELLSKKMTIETQPDPVVAGEIQVFARDGSGAAVQLINLANVTGPVTLTGSTLKAGASATTLAVTGGSIKGALTARDGTVATLRTNLDSLAKQIVTSVNAAYNPTAGTGNFFTSSNLTAGTISVDPTVTAAGLKASDGGPTGDNTIAQAVANLASTVFSTSATPTPDSISGTFSQFYTQTVTNLGQALSSTNTHVTNQTNIETLVRNQRDSVSGVSMDEEMADLMKYQRAFQASSRVIQVIDNLLDVVVNQLHA